MNITREWLWLAIGLFGPQVFTGRFGLRWLYSEDKKYSVIPVGFCYPGIKEQGE